MNGWITVPRSYFEGAAWRENRKLSKAEASLDLYQRAQWEAGEVFIRGKLVRLARGEQVASCRFLAERWGWTKDTVARYLKTMATDTRRTRANFATPNSLLIRSEVRQGETVLILCNYDEWTIAGLTACDTAPPLNETPPAPPIGTGTRQGRDKAKEGNQGKEPRNQTRGASEELFGTFANGHQPSPKSDPIEDAVAEIWEASHPTGRTRSSKPQLRDELRRLRKEGIPPAGTFRRSLEAWKASHEWTRNDGGAVPGVHLWVARRQWEMPESDLRSTVTANGRPRLSKEEIIRRLGGRAYDENGNLHEDLREQ